MNFLGHTHVALAGGEDEPGFVLGAVLPDLAPMAGIRLTHRELEGALGAGVRCHLQADAAFHADPRFVDGSRQLRRALTALGVGSGPARAVGHAGWELLLDGTLVAGPAEDAFRAALAEGDRALPALAEGDRERWAAFLARRGGPSGLHYDDAGWVADRLYAMLARRPRLALSAEQVPLVADVLDVHLPGVHAVAGAVLADTAGALA